MADKTYNVLFLCTGNSARSIMAEAILTKLAGDKFRAFSAGSFPKSEVHPFTLDLLIKQNYPTDDLRPKSWSEFDGTGAPQMDFVFTVCARAADETCPVWPGRPITAHWGFPDPVAFDGEDADKRTYFAYIFRMIARRLKEFVSLPVDTLDRLALQEKLDKLEKV